MGYVYSIVVITGWIALVILSAGISRVRWPNQKELGRKIIHIGIGPLIPLAWLLNISANLAISTSLAVTFALIINKKFNIIPGIEDIKRNSYGTIAYGLTISLLMILFWTKSPEAVIAAVLIMAFGDGMAGLIGQNINSKSWKIWGQRKSIAGTLTMAIISLCILTLLSFLIGDNIYPIKIIAITILSVSLEQLSPLGIDNITVPLTVAFSWSWMISI